MSDICNISNKSEQSDKEKKTSTAKMYLESKGITPSTLTSILNKTYPEPIWVVPKLLPQGVYLFAGKPKMGKSWICLDMSIAVGSGGRVFGNIDVEKGKSLYLALEDNERRIKKRTNLMLNGSTVSDNTEIITSWPRIGEGGIRALRAWLTCNTNARLVIIDTLAKFRPHIKSNENPYMADYKVGAALLPLADEFDVCILAASSKEIDYTKDIHVWIRSLDTDNANLMILLSFIISSHPDWKKARIRIFDICMEEEVEETRRKMKDLVVSGRLPITEKNIEVIIRHKDVLSKDLINEKSAEAGLCIIGFREERLKHDKEKVFLDYDKTGTTLFVNSHNLKSIN